MKTKSVNNKKINRFSYIILSNIFIRNKRKLQTFLAFCNQVVIFYFWYKFLEYNTSFVNKNYSHSVNKFVFILSFFCI